MMSLFPEILPRKRESPSAFPTYLHSSIRSAVPNRDISDPLARLSPAPVVQPLVVESRDGERKLFLCVDVSVRDCERGGTDGLRMGGVEDRAWRDEGRV